MDRVGLQQKLEAILGSDAVYFQPPPSLRLEYPCIVYHKQSIDTEHADNKIYLKNDMYQLIAIDLDPDTTLPDDILDEFEMISADRFYTADNLYHYPFTLYLPKAKGGNLNE